MSSRQLGMRANASQIAVQLLQIFLVGLTIGSTRVVIPGLAEADFGLSAQSFFLLASFVVVFGAVKAVMNLFAGTLSDRYGRKRVLISGWLVALPMPFILLWAPSWNWIIAATVLLGFNQGLAWSMALNSKLDFARSDQKGLVNGINEFSGYAAVGLAGVLSAYLAAQFGAREGLFVLTSVVILLGLVVALFAVEESLPWAELHRAEVTKTESASHQTFGYWFVQATLKHKALVGINQAGLVEKFTDTLVWVFLPIYFVAQGLSLITAGGLIAIYGVTWGVMQLITGPLSDKVGRRALITWGMIFCGVGVIAIPMSSTLLWWSVEAFVIGLGMAMLYPNLGAAVGDYAPVEARATLVGIYRFWRDSGYAFGALLMGLLAQYSQNMNTPFWFVGFAMCVSAAWFFVAVKRD